MLGPRPFASAAALPQPEVASIRLGMPHLALHGLSEGWLLRECGARHWAAIAAHFEVPPERLADVHGNRLYPSFLAARASGSPLGAFREGDEIRVATRLARLSRNRFLSRHRVSTAGAAAALQVELVSALLKRERTADNTSLREAELPPAAVEREPAIASRLAEADRAIRSRGAAADAAPGGQAFRFRYRPSPQCDFNGAGLLYFAGYHTIVDRAECERLGFPAALDWTTAERETLFFANINPGDEVEAVMFGLEIGAETLRHHTRLFRLSDGRKMAEIFTMKGVR